MQLVPPGGKPRMSKNASGKDGGVGLKTSLKVAKFAGSIYLKFYMGGMMGGQMSALNSLGMMNIGGMGSMQPMSMGGGTLDRTAGAANYVMLQVMAGAAAGAAAQGGPSFDAALEDAIEDAGQDIVESIKKAAGGKEIAASRIAGSSATSVYSKTRAPAQPAIMPDSLRPSDRRYKHTTRLPHSTARPIS